MKNEKRTFHKYEDMLHLPVPKSQTRKKMSLRDRAAQFSPFSAVVGYDHAVKEASRLTDEKRELDETQKAIIDDTLSAIGSASDSQKSQVTVVYFKPDPLKKGGHYQTYTGYVKRINAYEKSIYFTDGMIIPVESIYSLEIS